MTSRTRERSRAWFFTWDNASEISHDTVIDLFSEVEYVFQKERGEGGMIHFQGVIRYKNPRDNVGDLFQYCHWERCRNWRAAIKYCSKVDSRIAGPWTNIEGLKYRATIKNPLDGYELYEWQKQVLEIVDGEIDDRKVYWFWDENGCSGKTSLAKHICMTRSAVYLNGCSKDVLFAVSKLLEDRDIRVAVFGLARQDKSYVSYRSLEILKDGIGFSGKYESGMMLFNSMHVIVFANFAPDLAGLSIDRWEIVKI